MKPLRVLVLMHESLVPPASLDGYTEKQIEEFRTEYDVMANLEKAGHTVRALGLGDNLGDLRAAITDWKPDIAFNLLEEFQGIVTYDQYVVAFLELMKQPYTGCNPRGMMISRDKALSKQILAYHRIPTPGFAVFRRGQPDVRGVDERGRKAVVQHQTSTVNGPSGVLDRKCVAKLVRRQGKCEKREQQCRAEQARSGGRERYLYD